MSIRVGAVIIATGWASRVGIVCVVRPNPSASLDSQFMNYERTNKSKAPRIVAASSGIDDQKVIESSQLLSGGKELLIRHGDDVYRLIVTRNNKLILHK